VTSTEAIDTEALVREAESLKALLRDGLDRSARLLALIKHHHRQSRIVRSTLGALRQLQRVSG
jgi:hypothetical protein